MAVKKQPSIDTHPQTPNAPSSCALCGGCGGVLGGQSVQYAAAVFGQYGFFKEGLELFLGQRYGVGQQLFKKSHALAKPVCPVLALLLFLLLDQPLFLVFKLADFFLDAHDFFGFGLCHLFGSFLMMDG